MYRRLIQKGAATLACFIFIFSVKVYGKGNSSEDLALELADATPEIATSQPSNWNIFSETAIGTSLLRASLSNGRNQYIRQSISAQYQGSVADGLQYIFTDRLDLIQNSVGKSFNVNSFQEAYMRWKPDSNWNLETGRINLRNGVGVGYNPTDYFRTDAIRSFTSFVPATLRNSRLGTFMGGGQWIGDGRSLNLYFAPKLTSRRDNASLSLDVGATNNRDRWLLSGSQRLTQGFEPQWLLYQEEGESVQFGVNATWLAGNSTVFYLEASSGQKQTILDSLLNSGVGYKLQTQAAGGLTYTTPTKLSLTIEYDYASGSLGSQDISRFFASSYSIQQAYVAKISASQELPSRKNIFLFANWKDAGWTNFELSAMIKRENVTHSFQVWGEGRYHWSHTDIAIQGLRNVGDPNSIYGAAQAKQSWQLLLSHYF